MGAAVACVAALVLGLVTGSNALSSTPPAAHPASRLQGDGDQVLPDRYRHELVAPAVFVPRARSTRHVVALLPGADGISAVALTAYERAAQREQKLAVACHIPWQLVAAIGYIESDDGQFGGDQLRNSGDEATPLLGVPLNGSPGVALILDAHGHYARAEGPMQFLPSTWSSWQADGNGDHKADPQNVFDATAAAADYLCAGTGDLGLLHNQPAAVARYNDSPIYVKNVMNVERAYALGRPASTVKLIPMPTTPTCPKGKIKRAHSPKICVSPKHKRAKRAVAVESVVRPRSVARRLDPTPRPSAGPTPTTAAPSPSPRPPATPTPTPALPTDPATPSASPSP